MSTSEVYSERQKLEDDAAKLPFRVMIVSNAHGIRISRAMIDAMIGRVSPNGQR